MTVTGTPVSDRTDPVDEQPSAGWQGLAGLAGLFVLLAMLGGLSAVIVVVAILVIVFLHELGHFLTARWGGMKSTEFFLGFGPRIWSFRRGETEYGIKAIPAGAYVKIIGMNNLDEVDPADEARTYRQASFPRRLSVAVAGSAMHFLIALVLLFTLFAGFGFRGFVTSQEEFDQLTAEALESPDWGIRSVTPDSLAASVGLEPGDRVTAINGEGITSFADLTEIMADLLPGAVVDFEYVRGDSVLTGAGQLTEHPDFPGRGLLGVSPDNEISPPPRDDPFTAVGKTFQEFGEVSVESVTQLAAFFTPSSLGDFFSRVVQPETATDEGDQVVTGEGADEEGRILSIYGAARIGTSLTDRGVADLFQFLVILNIFIGIFNLVPLLPLDGGHVAIAVYERIRSIGGERYYADVGKLLPMVYAVVFVLISVGLAALYLDITDPII